MTADRLTNPYDLMDGAYDVPAIRAQSRSLGHVPIIAINPRSTPGLKEELTAEKRRCQRLGHRPAEKIRYNERTTVERVNGRIKDEFGGRTVRVHGHAKVMCHLMFGIVSGHRRWAAVIRHLILGSRPSPRESCCLPVA
jgi:hypothetical protein